jgi:DNA-binding NarL/FixJ family response regulator
MPPHLRLAPLPSSTDRPTQTALPVRVVLADDHTALRRSLRRVLGGERDIEVVAEATDLSMAMRELHDHLPHVLVLDLRLPDGSRVETIRRVRAQVPDTEIVVVTMEMSPLLAQQATDAGAAGFVLKDTADTGLPAAVRRAARGEEYVSARISARLEALRRAANADGLSLC